MICLIFVQYMKHRMQIMQQYLECDLISISLKLMLQTTLPSLPEGDNGVCN